MTTGRQAALVFALVAERLTRFYADGHWPPEGAMHLLARDWLARGKHALTRDILAEHLTDSRELARTIAGTLSREAGLLTAHEMQESLDPDYRSEVGQAMMDQCVTAVHARNGKGRA